MNNLVVFLPFQQRHWDMYLPIAQELEKKEINSIFIIIDAYHYSKQYPSEIYLSDIIFWTGLCTSKEVLITGSARLDLFSRSGDSLVGRFNLFHMMPLSLSEIFIGI